MRNGFTHRVSLLVTFKMHFNTISKNYENLGYVGGKFVPFNQNFHKNGSVGDTKQDNFRGS